jgi:hypothetical protein
MNRKSKGQFTVLLIIVALMALVLPGCPNLANNETSTAVPSAPAAPAVTATDRQLTISWTAVENAAAYEVWYGTSNNTESAQKSGDDVTGTTKTIIGLANGTVYFVWVKAKNEAGTSGFSPLASGTPQAAPTAPDAPVAPAVTAADRQLAVIWTAVENAAAYEVWYGTTDNTESAQKFGDDVTGVTKTITGLANGTTYYVWVKAKNGVGTSGLSPSASGTPQTVATAPGAPAAPTVNANDRQLTVTWTAVEDATAYEVWHGTEDNAENAQKSGDDVTGVTKTITGLANGTSYYVWVKAKNSVGTSGLSPSASGTPQAVPTAPGAPAAPTVNAGDRQLTITWTAVTGATAYEVWHGTEDNAENAQKSGDNVTDVTNTIAGLANGTTYYVWVKAKNSAGTSGFGPAASGIPQAAVTAPDAPAAPTVRAGDRQLTVSWTAVPKATAYEVWYGITDNTGSAQKSGDNETGATKTITGLANGTTYYVWVKAKNEADVSGFSPSASGTPQAAIAAPDAPAAPTVTAEDGQLTISWTAVTGATAYEVWYGTTDNTGSAQKSGDDETGATKTITGLTNGTACYVWIKAKNSAGTSAFSPAASGTPQAEATAPDAPAAPTVTAGNGQLTVSWTAVPKATAYEVWYGTTDNTGSAQKSGDDETGATKTITGLANGTTYYVWVKAKSSAGTSGFSPAANKAPLMPGANDATLSRFQLAGPNKLYRQHVVPKFSAATESCTLSVDYWVNALQLRVTTTQTGATVASSAATGTTQSGKVFTLSYALNNGGNNISIIVTAPDEVTTKTYTIAINRDSFYGNGTSMDTCTGAENVIPSWLLGYWSFVYNGNGDYEDVTITDQPVVSLNNLGRLEFGMPWGIWIAGDIVYSREFSSRSGILILRLDPNAEAVNPIDDPTSDGTGYYAVYYFDKVGDGNLGSSCRIFQSNQIGSGEGVKAYDTLEEAKEKFMVDKWYSTNLTTIDAVGDPQIKRPDDWVWDGVTLDWWED